MSNPKYFICPMSKQIVDAVLLLNSKEFGLLPSRRQINTNGGYCNGWNTESFFNYVRSKNDNIIIERDHGGSKNKKIDYTFDVSYFDIIHVDPFLNHPLLNNKEECNIHTINIIKYLYTLNPNVKYEILTEESVVKLTITDIEKSLQYFLNNLSFDIFEKIEYVVIQSGVSLDLVNMKNIGNFNFDKMISMINVCKKFGKKIKEHNGDYLSNSDYQIRFKNGVDSINIGPELVQIQTLCYLENMEQTDIDEFYKICLNSNTWKRWVTDTFDITDKNKLIQVCGHYCYSLFNLPNVDSEITEKIINKLKSLPQ
jgi:hypothetical protein